MGYPFDFKDNMIFPLKSFKIPISQYKHQITQDIPKFVTSHIPVPSLIVEAR